MSTRDLSAQLNRIVAKAIEEHELESFEEYWGLYEEMAKVNSVKAFFVRIEKQNGRSVLRRGDYCNVAIIGDGLLIDIEADDSDDSGNLFVQPLRSISRVSVQNGPLQNLSHSQGASLVVISSRIGEEHVGPYWVAKTDEEEEYLLKFAQALVQEISKA